MNDKRCQMALLTGLISLLSLWPAPCAEASGNLVIQPASIVISSFFSGSEMNIKGDLPAGCQAVLTIRGKRIDEELMRKSRHWDLWMNSGEVDIDNAPLLYLAFSSDPALLNKNGEYPWGYAALEKSVTFTGRIKPVEDDTIFSEFIQLKERDKLYSLYPGGLTIANAESGRKLAKASVHLPSRLKPGIYQVALWVLENDTILKKETATFDV
ncbi:MAG: TIGR02186 family protein, partial [Desulforhopalus sp.]